MFKKILLPLVLLIIGVLMGTFFFGESEKTVMPSPNNLHRNTGDGVSSLKQEVAFTGVIHEVKNGDQIMEAVKVAAPGDLIRVFPGVYKETVYVDKDDISFQGVIKDGEWPVLDGEKELNDEFEFVAKKLDFSVDELRKLFRSENKTYNDFPNNKYLIILGTRIMQFLGIEKRKFK